MRDQFVQLWSSLIRNSPKKQFEIDTLDDNFLFEFCKFRTLNHKLPIEYMEDGIM